ncbi:MAG: heat-inducible transcriptional repressor HrcA [Bacteroides sp.]|nr:heat-inducible transcriptional repressor HrcA [Eubacterium sp.]MCM1418230.1 heat-inducible transcriptional repressor HrcA [Roseburia sp.]MCM1463533.1 heat-inducible transcriptional repressor HrcA [Bacteroides sp.]
MESRALKILEIVVDEYIRTGEPIGSKAIQSLLDFKVSSATIRNEMASLEQQGYLEHPHTSAGRIPTYRGLRLYIERLSGRTALPEEEREKLDRLFEGAENETDEVIIGNASRALAEITKCAIVSTSDSARFSVITKVEVIPTGRRMYVLLMVTSGGQIRNRVCRLSFDLTEEQMAFFQEFARENLTGISPERVSEDFLNNLSAALGSYLVSLSPLLKGVMDLSAEMIGDRVMLEGEENLIACPELKGTEVAAVLKNRNEFTRVLDEAFGGIHVMFGAEDEPFVISNSSMITGSFSRSGERAGSFGVIGPLRLDYKKIIPYIEYFTRKVSTLLSQEETDAVDVEKEAETFEQE